MPTSVQAAPRDLRSHAEETNMRVFTAYARGIRFDIGIAKLSRPVMSCDPSDYMMVCAINFSCCMPVRIGSYLVPDYVSSRCHMTPAEAQAFVVVLATHCPELMLKTRPEWLA